MALLRSLPMDRLLTETDGPFTTIGDRKSVPADVLVTAERVAVARGISVGELVHVLSINAQRVFAFAGEDP